MASKVYTLQHPDGSEVTAQEVYDAFMSGRVILSDQANGANYLATEIQWVDANAGYDDPTNVVWVNITGSSETAVVGTRPGEK